MISLDAYLDEVIELPWAWGSMDCCLFAGNWIERRTGRDALAPYRGAYRSAFGARRLVVERGGLPAMVGAEMERCGFSAAGAPEHGDIGVVEQQGGELSVAGAAVAIFNGRWWIARALDGIAGLDAASPVAIWRVV